MLHPRYSRHFAIQLHFKNLEKFLLILCVRLLPYTIARYWLDTRLWYADKFKIILLQTKMLLPSYGKHASCLKCLCEISTTSQCLIENLRSHYQMSSANGLRPSCEAAIPQPDDVLESIGKTIVDLYRKLIVSRIESWSRLWQREHWPAPLPQVFKGDNFF